MYSEQFLKSYEEGDDELLTKTKSAPMVKFLDTEVITNEWQLFLFFTCSLISSVELFVTGGVIPPSL